MEVGRGFIFGGELHRGSGEYVSSEVFQQRSFIEKL